MRSNQSDEGLVKYEAGQDLVDMQQMTDSGDHTKFTITSSPWSQRAGYEPDIRPDGIRTGGAVTPSATVDKVSIEDVLAYIAGASVEATTISDASLTRSTEYNPGETYIINSITLTSGGTIAVLAGAEGSAFSTTRGNDGGPPLIPTTSIELAWVRLSSTGPAVVTASEILQIPGTSQEKYDFPSFEENFTEGYITFISALPASHVGGVTKNVYIEVYTPIFASLEPCGDFVPIETAYSQSSTPVYGGTIGSSSSSLNQGGFTYYGKDGITDAILALKGLKLWFKFYQHRDKDPYLLSNGIFGIARSFPASDNIAVACTVTGSEESQEFDS